MINCTYQMSLPMTLSDLQMLATENLSRANILRNTTCITYKATISAVVFELKDSSRSFKVIQGHVSSQFLRLTSDSISFKFNRKCIKAMYTF